jgi:hypothetical protein
MADLSSDKAVIAAAVAIDKMRLLRDQPTCIDEQRGEDRLRIFRERYQAAQSDLGNGQQHHGPPGPPV